MELYWFFDSVFQYFGVVFGMEIKGESREEDHGEYETINTSIMICFQTYFYDGSRDLLVTIIFNINCSSSPCCILTLAIKLV